MSESTETSFTVKMSEPRRASTSRPYSVMRSSKTSLRIPTRISCSLVIQNTFYNIVRDQPGVVHLYDELADCHIREELLEEFVGVPVLLVYCIHDCLIKFPHLYPPNKSSGDGRVRYSPDQNDRLPRHGGQIPRDARISLYYLPTRGYARDNIHLRESG